MREDSWIFRLQRGDRTALEEIYKTYRPSFINWIVYTHKCSKDEAIDIYQYSIITLYENVIDKSVEEMNDAGIKTYLFSIGKNKLLSDTRRQSKFTYQDSLDENDLIEVIDSPSSNRGERLRRLEKIIQELGSPCADILKLFYFNNLSTEEIADVLDYKNGNTVKNLKYKCLQRVKKKLNNP
ncbi:RNA polymerase sigma-70 factor (ECF subfamily) [Roseivirga pacifica]|uniref:RNA polymerase sigma-70 factor, ECF subfamily n=1 Tax=Roseivirga pacifica TaxID=1267423 RepID=A0A1I0MXU4_9BACT|nr:sigma-70 family RNA polymerase sigma factor [Roseivirga pacifica]MCO6359299.1 sigma-70 family RNA polymerase sigma factor [Roseivirga pacifica]MCO6366669.1 sigma-70 family RNA polymerase sigma factor [Roseivirga pacifica]MCO6370799.1 sigma-70 family RNA polymerase sigma factor [Roseivirga pacifica]MCO6374325.1 sigma-70 family RNA polymerase sigma factor [Roseivirga pacifica]MCO6379584.1 sigma-70 family RNA polymerase sigma factor [Roseivirga pacifica]